MKPLLRVLAVAVLSVLLHVLIGWAWTAGAGIAAGLWVQRRGWLLGLGGVALGWAFLVAYSFAVAPQATAEMTRIFSGLLGNLPAFVTVAATVVLGAIIGALSGLLGSLIAASLKLRGDSAPA